MALVRATLLPCPFSRPGNACWTEVPPWDKALESPVALASEVRRYCLVAIAVMPIRTPTN